MTAAGKFHHRQLLSLFSVGLVSLYSGAVTAAPWIEPGDMRMRHSLTVLADQGDIRTPINTWPVMWSGVGETLSGLSRTGGSHSGQERSYVRFEQDRFARRGWASELNAGIANQPPLIRSFNDQTREEGVLGVTAQWNGHSWALGLSAQVTEDPSDGRDWRADGSFLAYTGNSWTLGFGAIDRWWGPGWQSSLMLSSNARPVPSLWLNRTNPSGSDHPLLAWMGPFQLTLTLGQLEGAREVPEARLVGLRFNFRPVKGLELGLSRLLQYGGEGEPENGEALGNALILSDESARESSDAPTQMAGLDARYGMAVGGVSGGLYGETVAQVGEDQSAGGLTGLVGMDLAYSWQEDSQRWFLEYADTTAGNITGSGRFNETYEDPVYKTGDRFRGRAIGSTFDSDAQALTLGLQHFFNDGRNLALTVGHIQLNRSDDIVAARPSGKVDFAIAREATDVVMVSARYEYPLWGGWATLDGQWSDRTIEIATADGSGRAQGTLSAGWRYRF
ncbi:MAG: capsule assembly Wzi family protein [Oleiphilaceae bacterium]|nr:capsule assembly Wzi family protein [Oleiphilaceae bacterium]